MYKRQVQLTPEEQAMVDSFAEKIDITNSQQVLQYGSACQKMCIRDRHCIQNLHKKYTSCTMDEKPPVL